MLNRSKSAEIVFSDSRKRHHQILPPPLPETARVKSLKVLGITISSRLSPSKHVNNVISSCACTPSVLRAHGLCRGFTASLQVRRGCKINVRIPCLVGFASAADQQWVEVLLRHSVRSGLYPPQLTAEELIDSTDDKLFDHVLRNGDHVLHELLPECIDISYNLRSRSHDRVIPEKRRYLAENNFVTRMLYKSTY